MITRQTRQQAINETILAMGHACRASLFAMGREGANYDTKHPLREAWEACRETVSMFDQIDPLNIKAIQGQQA